VQGATKRGPTHQKHRKRMAGEGADEVREEKARQARQGNAPSWTLRAWLKKVEDPAAREFEKNGGLRRERKNQCIRSETLGGWNEGGDRPLLRTIDQTQSRDKNDQGGTGEECRACSKEKG